MSTPSGPAPAAALGIDIGTSGVRAVVLDDAGLEIATASRSFTAATDTARPDAWWAGVTDCLSDLSRRVALASIRGIAVDGTSGTVLGLDGAGRPVGDALMYNAPAADEAVVAAIVAAAPAGSPAIGRTSPLAKAAELARRPGVVRVLHQADWIAWKLRGDGEPISDENNALKTGYDLEARAWPAWIGAAGIDPALLPVVVPAGQPLGSVGAQGQGLGLPASAVVHAGTTDGCASFLATGASEPGEGVTALGSTLVLKLVSNRPVAEPRFGVYSHRVGSLWLAGGASNSGGAVLRMLFGDARLGELSAALQPDRPTGLDYYPLTGPGERFPVSDPALAPRLDPRPADDAVFFQGVLEGIAAIESRGYALLAERGAPRLARLRSVGGGAANAGWTQIRQRLLGVPFVPALSTEAAAGAARLVLLHAEGRL